MADAKTLNRAVRELREALGLTQEQFASKVGKTLGTVQRYEQQRPPQGLALVPFIQLAESINRRDLVATFTAALTEELRGVMDTLCRYHHTAMDVTVSPPPNDEERSWLLVWLEFMRKCPPEAVKGLKHTMTAMVTLALNQRPKGRLEYDRFRGDFGWMESKSVREALEAERRSRRKKQ